MNLGDLEFTAADFVAGDGVSILVSSECQAMRANALLKERLGKAPFVYCTLDTVVYCSVEPEGLNRGRLVCIE